jgi:hypothetical protein
MYYYKLIKIIYKRKTVYQNTIHKKHNTIFYLENQIAEKVKYHFYISTILYSTLKGKKKSHSQFHTTILHYQSKTLLKLIYQPWLLIN